VGEDGGDVEQVVGAGVQGLGDLRALVGCLQAGPALVALAATALGPVQAASAAAALPVLSVHSGSAGGFTVSGATSRRAGRVVLNFTNSNAHGSDVQLLKLLHGTTMATVIRDIQAQEGMGAAASTRALTRETHLFGASTSLGRTCRRPRPELPGCGNGAS